MFKHILVPLDGSSFAEAAMPAAVEIADRFDSKITLIHVLRPIFVVTGPDGFAYAESLKNLRDQACEEAKVYLGEQCSWLRHHGFTAQNEIIESESVAEAILDMAEQSDVDAIVMSTHGRGGISRWVYGSVADKVLRYASVPVLLIRVTNETVDWPPAEVPDS